MSEEKLSGPALHRKIAEVMEILENEALQEPMVSSDYILKLIKEAGFSSRKPKVKLSGEVEPEVIEWAYEVQGWADSKEANEVAKALLSCVEKEK